MMLNFKCAQESKKKNSTVFSVFEPNIIKILVLNILKINTIKLHPINKLCGHFI